MIRFDGITIYRPACRIRNGAAACRLPPELFRFACALLLAGPKTTREMYELVFGCGSPHAAAFVSSVVIPQLRIRLARIGITIHSKQQAGPGKQYWAEPTSLPQREAAE